MITEIDYSPRPSQQEIIAQILDAAEDHQRILFQSATGSGKTVIIGNLIIDLLQKRYYKGYTPSDSPKGWICPHPNPTVAPPQILFVVHRDKLVKQTLKAFAAIFRSRWIHGRDVNAKTLDLGITVIQSGRRYEFYKPVVVVSQQSLQSGRLKKMIELGQINPVAVFYDEAHTTATNPTGVKMCQLLDPIGCLKVGATATPFWDGESVASDHFDIAVCGKSFGELLVSNELCPLVYLEPDYPQRVEEEYIDFMTKRLKTREVDCAYETPDELDYAIDKWVAIDGPEFKSIAFAKSVTHGESIVEAFRRRGFNADIVSYKQDQTACDNAFKRFEVGDGQVLVSVDSLGVGYDFNKIRCVILLAPVHSLIRHWQQMGRGSRLCNEPGFVKPFCYVLDFVRNIQRHGDFGIPDTVKLTPEMIMGKKPKQRKNSLAPTKICPKCDFVNFANSRKCARYDFLDGQKVYTCDHVFPIKTLAKAMQIIPGDMHRIFMPGMIMTDEDRIAMMRSLRAKRFARGQNPNIAIDDYNSNPLSEGLPMPHLTDLDALKMFTIGALRGKPHSEKDAILFLSELLRLKKTNPARWTTPVIFSVIALEYDDNIANVVNFKLLDQKISAAEQFCLAI
jgi:superfamily II DNA or RNA helicase